MLLTDKREALHLLLAVLLGLALAAFTFFGYVVGRRSVELDCMRHNAFTHYNNAWACAPLSSPAGGDRSPVQGPTTTDQAKEITI